MNVKILFESDMLELFGICRELLTVAQLTAAWVLICASADFLKR